ncbi:MAG: hypothetical protein VCC04_06745 [Myxococcota bacterium]
MRKYDPEGNEPRGLPVWVGLVLLLGLGVVAGAWLWSPSTHEPVTRDLAPVASRPEVLAPPAKVQPVQPGAAGTAMTPADISLRQGVQVEIAAAALPDDRPSVLELRFSEEHSQVFGIKSAWLYREGGEPLEIRVTRSGPASVRTELPPGTLAPGRAILELRTDEISPLPLRRFALQIR